MKQMNRKTKMIIGGALAIAVIIISVLVALSLTIWAQPSKQDFEAAKKYGEKVVADYPGSIKLKAFAQAVVVEGRAGKSGDELVAAVADEKKAVIDTIDNRRAFGKMVAESRVIRDQETKKSFDTYMAREKKYDAYYLAYVDAFPPYYSSLSTCIEIFSVARKATDDKQLSDLHRVASRDCLADLMAFSENPITPYANYAKELIRIVNGRQNAIDSIVKDPKAATEANDTIKQLARDQSKNDPTDAVRQYGEEASFDGELNALISVLGKKADAAK